MPDEEQGEDENIDIAFRGVFYLDIPATLSGLKVDSPEDDELRRLAERTGVVQDPAGRYHKYFVLTSQSRRYYIGALDMFIARNKLGMMETSLGIAYQVPG